MFLAFRKSATVLLFVLCAFLLWVRLVCAQGSPEKPRRAITVADAIAMTRLAEGNHGDHSDATALFSPDGKRFVVVLQKGNLANNTNEYSVYLYQTADVFSSPKPDLILTMASSTNQDAIKALRWLDDGQTLAFVGENPGEVSQVYTFDLRTRRLTQITHSLRAVKGFGITGDSRTLLYAAGAPPKKWDLGSEKARRDGVVVRPGQNLADLLNEGEIRRPDDELYLQKLGGAARQIPVPEQLFDSYGQFFLHLSPDGRYALIGVRVRNIVPPEWAGYQDHDIQEMVATHLPGGWTGWKNYFLLDTASGSVEPFLNTPMAMPRQAVWASDSRSVFLESYLPLNIADAAELEARAKEELPVEVKLPSREIRRLALDELKAVREKAWKTPSDLLVRAEEDLNTPPKIVVADPKTKQKALLLDLNPQFSSLAFGKVERVEFKTSNGVGAICGLYLPPDYMPGKRYPLVIQTHGFHDKKFSMDGIGEWSSAFAARPLAAKGIIVLQMQEWENEDDISAGKFGGKNELQSFKLATDAAYEGAVDYLNSRSLIDKDSVGIGGFSLTVSTVAYTLTHSKYHWAAAALTDGVDNGYFQYLAFPDVQAQFNNANGGVRPFGVGLQEWLKESPTFSMDKVRTPVRLVAITVPSVVSMWEWFSALSMQRKPVDFVMIPDGTHIMAKPWERRTTMQGIVDWFCFWLKNEEDQGPAKAEQYERWRELRKLQQDSNKGSHK